MKKKYIAPEMEIFNIQVGGALLAGSATITPHDWTGGGDATCPMNFDDENMNFLMGGGDFSDFEKLLGM